MITYGFWFYKELLDLISSPFSRRYEKRGDNYIDLKTPNETFSVKISSIRMQLFRQNPKCVSCNRVGSVWMLQAHRPKEVAHLNLYHVGEPIKEWKKLSVDGLVMMTKDHILPRSLGGPTTLENLQVMCTICNSKKGCTYNRFPKVFSCTEEKMGEMLNINGFLHLH